MSRIGIVVQRCHPSVVGGSEALAWQYAALLHGCHEVEVLTTTAVDAGDWKNVLRPGEDERDGIVIRRFPVTVGRSPYWHRLHALLMNHAAEARDRAELEGPETALHGGETGVPASSESKPLASLTPTLSHWERAVAQASCLWPPARPRRDGGKVRWNLAMQEEFIRRQGPYSEPMLEYLRTSAAAYDAVIFVTYLFPTTYFGMCEIPAHRSILVPTLHDEAPAYLSAYRRMARQARMLLWNTEAERRLGERLWGDVPGRVVGMGIDTAVRQPAPASKPYLLYCGRIDEHKGCRELLQFFHEFKQRHRGDLRLILTGKDELGLGELPPDVEYRGYVASEEKFALMAGAALFVMPSPNESLSLVTLEAMAQQTPVLVNGVCEVLADHVARSRGGRTYRNLEDFVNFVRGVVSQPDLRRELGAQARAYVVEHYHLDRVKENLIAAIHETPSRTTAAA